MSWTQKGSVINEEVNYNGESTVSLSNDGNKIAIGSVKTKQLVKALVHDFLQTLFIILVVVCFIVYGIYHYASGLF